MAEVKLPILNEDLPEDLGGPQIHREPEEEHRPDVPGELKIFIDVVEAHYGRRPLIYTTNEFNQLHLDGELLNERYWLRNLFAQPDFRRDAWVIWQYNHDGRRPGVQGPVDLNYFRGDEAAFERFASGAPGS